MITIVISVLITKGSPGNGLCLLPGISLFSFHSRMYTAVKDPTPSKEYGLGPTAAELAIMRKYKKQLNRDFLLFLNDA